MTSTLLQERAGIELERAAMPACAEYPVFAAACGGRSSMRRLLLMLSDLSLQCSARLLSLLTVSEVKMLRCSLQTC